MRAVTVKNLMEWFKGDRHHPITEQSAKALVKLLKAGDRDPDAILEAANVAVGGFGVEGIRGKMHDRYYMDIVGLYVNTGDTYSPTVLYDTVANRFYVTTMGDFVEAKEEEYEIE